MRRHIVGLMGLLAFLAAGCTSEQEVVTNGQCAGEADCETGLICVDSACVSPPNRRPDVEEIIEDTQSDASGTEQDSAAPSDSAVAQDAPSTSDSAAGQDTAVSDSAGPTDTAEQQDSEADSSDEEDAFTEDDALPLNTPPTATIASPVDDAVFAASSAITLEATIGDQEEDAQALTVQWTSSLQGALGSGSVTSDGIATLTTEPLLPGLHLITLTVVDSGALEAEDTVPILINTAPGAPEVVLEPVAPTTTDELVALVTLPIDPDRSEDFLTETFSWLRDGEPLPELDGATVDAAYTEKGQSWTVIVSTWDGFDTGPEATAQVNIVNAVPTCPEALLGPEDPTAQTALSCTCPDRSDADDEPAEDRCVFVVNGVATEPVDAVDGACAFDATLTKGDAITCQYIAADSDDEQEPTSSETVTVANTAPGPPTITLSPTEGNVTTTFECAITEDGADIDGDVLSYARQWRLNGYLNPAATGTFVIAETLVSDDLMSPAQRGDEVQCEVWSDDGESLSASVISAPVILGNSPPTGGLVVVGPQGAAAGSTLSCTVTGGADADGDPIGWSISWTIDGEVLEGEEGPELNSPLVVKGAVVGCSATPSDGFEAGEQVTSGNELIIDNTPPNAATVSLLPDVATVQSELSCPAEANGDIDNDAVSLIRQWIVNDFVNQGLDQEVVQVSALARNGLGEAASKGDVVVCQVIVNDGTSNSEPAQSNPLTIENANPQGGKASITPEAAFTDTALSCLATDATDPDDDTLSYLYTWLADGEVIEGEAESVLDSDATEKGQTITCQITPTDGAAFGGIVAADNAVFIDNSLPTAPAVSIAPEQGSVSTTFTCSLTEDATDLDGDVIDYEVTWYAAGYANPGALDTPITPAELFTNDDGSTLRGEQALVCSVVATDGQDLTAAVQSAAVILDNSAPEGGQVSVEPQEAGEQDIVSCNASAAVDPDGDTVSWLFSWTVDAVEVPGITGANLDGAYFDKGQTVSCTAIPTDGKAQGQAVQADQPTIIVNTAPTSPYASLEPLEAGVLTELDCVVSIEADDPDGDTLTYEVVWLVNGFANTDDAPTRPAYGLVSDPDGTPAKGGDSVSCVLRASDGTEAGPEHESNALVLSNTAPQDGTVQVLPAEATETDTLTCMTGDAWDPDGDEVSWVYAWFVNDQLVIGATSEKLLGALFDSGDSVHCEATPTDGEASGETVRSENTVSVANSLPSQPEAVLAPSLGGVLETFTCTVTVEGIDPDGEVVEHEIRWLVNGHLNEASTDSVVAKDLVSNPSGSAARGGDTIQCRVRAKDSFGFSEPAFTEIVTLSNTPPVGGEVWIDPPEAAAGVTLMCMASGAVDPDGDDVIWTYAWFVGGDPLSDATGDSLSSDNFSPGELVTCAAIPSDGTESAPSIPSSNGVAVGNTVPTQPVVSISPSAGPLTESFECAIETPSEDPDGDPVSYETRWIVNGFVNTEVTGSPVTGLDLASDALGTPARGGDTLSCEVRASDGIGLSTPGVSGDVIIANTAPVGGSVSVSPETVREGESVTCSPSGATDIDGDSVTWTIAWFVDDVAVSGQSEASLESAYFDKGQSVTCHATPTDGQDEGDAISASSAATVLNTPPSIETTTITPSEVNRLGTFNCVYSGATDLDPADGDPEVSYRWLTFDAGQTSPIEGETGSTLAAGTLNPGDSVVCEVTPSDSEGEGPSTTSAPSTVINNLPTITQVALSPGLAFSNDTLTCTPVGIEDIDEDNVEVSYTWLKNGDELTGQSSATLVGQFDRDDVIRCVVTPFDGYEAGQEAISNEVTILNTLPSLATLTLSPEQGLTCGTFTCTPGEVVDPDPSDASVELLMRWELNGDAVTNPTDTFTSDLLEPGDTLQCFVAPWDGTLGSSGQPKTGEERASGLSTVINAAPIVTGVTVSPTEPQRGDILTCSYEAATDECDAPLQVGFGWRYNDGTFEEPQDIDEDGPTLDTSAFEPGTTLGCAVVADDGFDESPLTEAEPINLLNAPPTPPVVAVQAPSGADGAVSCVATTPASDGEPLTSTVTWTIDGGDSFVGGASLSASQVEHCDLITCSITVSDTEFEATSNTAELVLGFGDDCNDGNACTQDSCDQLGGCAHADLSEINCDDGLSCTHTDRCDEGSCVGVAYSCDDADPCTDDACNGDDSCSYTFNSAPCDDGQACTLADVCDGGLCAGIAADCSQLNTGCLEGTCAGICEAGDECVCSGGSCAACELTPNVGLSCDDSDECTLADACDETGACVGTWDKVNCGCTDDAKCEADPEYNDACHIGRCDMAIFKCYKEPLADGDACDDGQACTYGDTCQSGVCEATEYSCDDANPCTDDSCAGDSTCVHTNNTIACDDGDACTTNDTCTAGSCVGGAPPQCDDGAFCNGLETCDTTTGCVNGTPPTLDDGVDCTVDTCDEVNDIVVNAPDDAFCASTDLCTVDTCDVVEGCVKTVETGCCGNGTVDTGEVCDDGNIVSGDGCDSTCTCECVSIAPKVCIQPVAIIPDASGLGVAFGPNVTANATAIVHGDVDGDGLADLIVAFADEDGGTETHREVRLFINPAPLDPENVWGEGVALPALSNNAVVTDMALADFDRDGDLDLFITRYGADDRLILNSGTSTPFSTAGDTVDTGSAYSSAVAVGDIDRDGTLDIAVAHRGVANHIVLNLVPLSPFAGATPLAITGATSDTRDIALVDSDYDGDLDIITAEYDGINKAQINLGMSPYFLDAASSDVGTDALSSTRLILEDFDLDGYVDLVVANGAGQPDNFYRHPGPISGVVYGFVGAPAFALANPERLTRGFAALDTNLDGRPDLMRATDAINDAVINNGTAYALFQSPAYPISANNEASMDIITADFDADGDGDFVTIQSVTQARYFEGDLTTPLNGVVDPNLLDEDLTLVAVGAGDVDADGDNDIFALPASGAPFLTLNNGSEAPFLYAPVFDVEGAGSDAGTTMVIGDVNRDGRPDMVVGRSGAVDIVYLHTLAFPFYTASSSAVLPDTVGQTTEAIAIDDVNRDGTIDIVTADNAGTLSVHFGDGSAALFGTIPSLVVDTGLSALSGVASGDFNRDGLRDIVISGSSDVRIYQGQMTTTGYALDSGESLSGDGDGWGAIAVGDIDQDGDDDIVVARRQATNLVYLNDGSSTPFVGVTPATLDTTSEESSDIDIADVDMDGDLDVVVSNEDAVNRVYLTSVDTTGVVSFTAQVIIDEVEASTALTLASIDTQGRADLVVGNSVGRLQLFTTPFLDGTLPAGQCAMACPVVPLNCDDELYCNGLETCSAADACIAGTAPSEEDAVLCTDSVCDEATDSILHVPNDANCATDELCSNDYCDVDAGGCVFEQALDCCGNDLLETGEFCEDGNIDPGDGCDAQCQCECALTGPFLCLDAAAVSPFNDATVEEVGLGGTAATDVVFVDINRDGLMDAVVSHSDSPNQVFLSTGTSEPFKDVLGLDITADSDHSVDMDLGDVNGDGFVDVAVANDGAPTKIYLHNGTNDPFNGVTPIAIGADDGVARAINLVDLNVDGKLDVVVSYNLAPTRVYYHNGTATPFLEEEGTDVSAETFSSLAMASADITGNGYPDVILATDGFNVMLENTGPPNYIVAPSSVIIAEVSGETIDLALRDMDKDGDIDVVTFNRATPSQLLLSNGDADPFVDVTPLDIDDGGLEVNAGHVADINGDGWLDIIVANGTGPNVWMPHQPGAANPFDGSTKKELALDLDQSVAIDTADVDHDGDLDIIVANVTAAVHLYLNQASVVEDALAHPDLDEITSAVRAGIAHDIDNDGDLDLLIGSHSKANQLISNNGTISPFHGSSPTDLGVLSRSSRAVAVGDLNGDGWDDLIVGNHNAPMTIWLHNKTASPFTSVTPLSLGPTTLTVRDIALGDINRDGRLDLVVAQHSGEDQLWLNDGDPSPFSTTTPIGLGGAGNATWAVAIGDINSDGWLDILIGYRTGGHNVALISDQNNPPTFTSSAAGWAWEKTEGLELADFNGDGKLDVISANNDDPDILLLHNGSATPYAHSNAITLGAGNTPSGSVAVGDIDQDGDVDILMGREDAANVIFFNNGTSTPFTGVDETVFSSDSFDTRDVVLGHFDQDGLLDLVALDHDSVDHFYPNRVLNGQAPPEGCAGGCNPVPVTCEDNNPCTLNGCTLAGGCDFSEVILDCCGNGVVETGEACDDGDVDDGDGCSATCAIE